jgi:hypothetical protein
MAKLEMEPPLSTSTSPPGEASSSPAKTDGLAATIAAGTAGGAPSPAPARNVGGRPPIHGRYSKAAGSDGKNPVKVGRASPVAQVGNGLAQPENPVETPPRVVIPEYLLARVVKEALTLTENAVSNAIEGKARAAGLTDEEIATQIGQAQLGEDRKQLVAELMPFVLEEYGVNSQLSPTLAVSLVLAPWAFGSYTAFTTLSALARERARQPKKPETKPPAE